MASRQRFDDFQSYPLGVMSVPTANGFWKSADGRLTPVIVSSALDGGPGPRTGTKMMRLNFDATLPNSGTGQFSALQQITTGISYTNELFYRWYFRMDNDMQVSNIGSYHKFFRIFAHPGGNPDPDFNDFFWSLFGSNTSFGFRADTIVSNTDVPNPPGFISINISSSGRVQWNKMELYINLATSTVKYWYNGTLFKNIAQPSTNFHNASSFLDFYPQSNWGDVENSGFAPGANNHYYWADYEIYSDVGSGATGLMSDASIQAGSGSDTTPPAAPTNLRFV